MPRFPIVDAHQHFWDLTRNYYPWLCDKEPIPFRYGDYSAIRRNYLPPDLRRDSAGLDLRMTVHMEAEWDRADPVAETRWLESLNAATGLPTACIGHAEFERNNIGDLLAGHAASPLMRGIRQKPAATRSATEAKRGQPGSMDDPAWRNGYALMEKHGLSYDLQTPWWHLDAAAELATDFPRTTIIINHTGLPADRSAEGLAAWRAALERVAAQPNVAIKISGLGQRGLPWTVEANAPIIRDTIAIFGVDRCMFASNYPVDSLAGSYRDIFAGFFAAVADRPDSDQRKLFHDNAVRLYRLA
ncbi:MAG: amidohydrolase family protein [Proteobacteria bacterium]|nr:amidohydrolase family protein [Pseudomonadota bacterium]